MSTELTESQELKSTEINKYDFKTETTAVFKARKGIDAEIVNQISDIKNEPDWMRQFRLEALEIFESKPMPKWGGDIDLDFQDIFYYLKPTTDQGKSWDDVPEEIKDTFEKLGIPEAERKYLAGVKAQFESEVIYGSLKKDLSPGRTSMRTRSRTTPNIVLMPTTATRVGSRTIGPTDSKSSGRGCASSTTRPW